jgi:hypothetical protein
MKTRTARCSYALSTSSISQAVWINCFRRLAFNVLPIQLKEHICKVQGSQSAVNGALD